jgi:hypothetical protein
MNKSTPLLALLYPLVTDPHEFKRFRNDSTGYLEQHGIAEDNPAYAAFVGVSRGGTQTRASLDPVVKRRAMERRVQKESSARTCRCSARSIRSTCRGRTSHGDLTRRSRMRWATSSSARS